MLYFVLDDSLTFRENNVIVKGLKAGQRVDQFRVVRKLGRGGMSEVYLARDERLGRKVALKIIRAELADSPRRLKLFLQEARLTAKFSHQHIITIYTVGQFEGHPYLALEYLEGQTLHERICERAFVVGETMRIGLAIAQALKEAHSHGVLHRDLKPANIIIPRDGRLRVLDFGISKIVEDDLQPSIPVKDVADEVTPDETALGELKGTPTYMAPERWHGGRVTGAADVWALGVILYTMLTQVHPFYGEDQQTRAIARRIVLTKELPPLPPELNVPLELSQLIMSMLDREASRRPTAMQVVEILQGLVHRGRSKSLEKRSPFRGLLPFSERHADLFFGRSAEIEMAVERLRHQPILPVVGPSGAGKSSFVAAGIVPRLKDLDRWLVLRARPGTDPFGALSSIIQASWRGEVGYVTSSSTFGVSRFPVKKVDQQDPAVTVAQKPARNRSKQGEGDYLEETETATVLKLSAEESSQSADDLEVTETCEKSEPSQMSIATQGLQSKESQSDRWNSSDVLAQKLLESPAMLLLELLALADETRCRVLLFIDQLEELYTQNHEQSLCRAYMEAISRAADDPEGPIRVVFTLREDFLGRVADTPSAQEALSRIAVLRALGDDALLEIVTKPLELAGYSYEDEKLPDEMIKAVRGAPASLPILQFACSQLWNRRDTENRLLTRSAYLAMGGVEGALAYEADELLAGLSEAQRKVVRQLMLRLVTPEGTRRVIAVRELLDGLDSSAALVLNRLTTARLVVSRRAQGRENAEAELELVHDSLIHNWKPLVRWLELSREEVVFLDEVSRAAELWDTRGRPREEVWSGDALDEARARIKRCEAVPQRVIAFLEAGELQHQARAGNRRRLIIAGFGILLSVIAALAAVIREESIQRGIAVEQRELAVSERNRQQLAHASSLREGALASYTKGDFLEARSKLRASLETRDSTQARALWWLLENEPLVWSKALDSPGNCVRASPDGRLIAVSSNYINIYDTKTLERRLLSGHKRRVMDLEFSPDGRWLASGSFGGEIRLWNLREGTVKVLKGHIGTVWTTAFSPDGKRLVSGSDDKKTKIWDIQSGSPVRFLANNDRVFRLRFSPDGRFIISTHRKDKLYIWNTQSYELESFITEPEIQIQDAAISADGKLLAYGGSGGVIVVRNLETRQELARISSNTKFVQSLSFSSNCDFLTSSTDDGKVQVWSTKTWSLHRQFSHSKVPVLSVSFLPDGEQIVSAGGDQTVKLWTTRVQSFHKESAGHRFPIYGLSFASDGKTIATGSSVDGEVRLWDAESGQSTLRIHGHDTDIFNIAFNHSGKLLAVGSHDASIRLYTIPGGTLLKTLLGHTYVVSHVVFSPDKTQLISSSYDKTIAFWDLKSLTLQKSITTGSPVIAVDIDPEGRLLASAHFHSVNLRDIETGQVLKDFSGHKNRVWSAVFSPDGRSLYSSSWDHTVRRYQLKNSSNIGEIVARHQGNIYWIDVTYLEEEILGTPSEDGTAKLWKVDSDQVITLNGHQGDVNGLKFSPDGTRTATVGDDTTLRLWDTKTGRPLWRAPLMLEELSLLLTQQGWIGFDDDAKPEPLTKQWQKAVDARGKLASATADQKILCVATFNDELELWNIFEDERSSIAKLSEIQQVLAIRMGCLTRSLGGTLSLMKAHGELIPLGKQVDAMSRLNDSVFVLQAGSVRILDLEGNEQDQFTATAGASSLTIVEQNVVLGFPDGRIEVWRRNLMTGERDVDCREVESCPVTTLIPGPPGTFIAGFANGSIGIWSIETGERLYSNHLHGPVIHLLHRDRRLWAATELGTRLRLDLSTFYTDYCELMKRVWSTVPWIWEEGRARFREQPSDHECEVRR